VVEFFPKPPSADPEKLPKGLNMPYLGGKFGFVRPGSKVGDELPPEEFLRCVERLSAKQRRKLVTQTPSIQATTNDEGAAYAASMLARWAKELGTSATGRNNMLNSHAFNMGRMIARGWLARDTVENALLDAAETCGLLREELLEKKLLSEWSGILSWMIDGCLAWQEHGLVRPEVVQVATEDYFSEQDLFGQWLEERVERTHTTTTTETSTRLFLNWCSYADAAGEKPGSRNAFAEQLRQRGFSKRKSHGTQVYEKVRLKQPDHDPRDDRGDRGF
jgi:hypothetical protein